jgi:hypothetical protein
MKTCVCYMFNSDNSSNSMLYRLVKMHQVIYDFPDKRKKTIKGSWHLHINRLLPKPFIITIPRFVVGTYNPQTIVLFSVGTAKRLPFYRYWHTCNQVPKASRTSGKVKLFLLSLHALFLHLFHYMPKDRQV